MRGEGRERLLYRLLVADIGEDFVEYGEPAPVARGYHKPAHRHERKEADRLYRHRLAACVGTRYNERIEVRAEPYVHGDNFIFIYERMTSGAKLYLAVGVQQRHRRAYRIGILRLRKNHIELNGALVAVLYPLLELADHRGEGRQYALYLVLFL